MNNPIDTGSEIFTSEFLRRIRELSLYAQFVIECHNGEIVMMTTTQKYKPKDFYKIVENSVHFSYDR